MLRMLFWRGVKVRMLNSLSSLLVGSDKPCKYGRGAQFVYEVILSCGVVVVTSGAIFFFWHCWAVCLTSDNGNPFCTYFARILCSCLEASSSVWAQLTARCTSPLMTAVLTWRG